MRRIVISLSLLMGLLIHIAPPASAAENCLANFADIEWSNGTPSGVKSLLGFDLVEKITKTPSYIESIQTSFAPINNYFLFGEFTEYLTYNYVGKNCTSRDVVVSRFINENSINYKYASLSDRIDAEASNFQVKQNSIKFYDELKKYLTKQTFEVNNKESENSSALLISRFIDQEESKYDRKVVSLGSASDWFIYFPSKCGSFMQRVTPGQISPFPVAAPLNWAAYTPIEFKSNGNCLAELRIGGQYSVAEKISDVKYFVKASSPTKVITCTKGKLTKKVTAVKPKCPAGYKVKK
jgi:hypothetical protein